MATPRVLSASARFGGFVVDLNRGELRTADGTRVRIQQKPLQLLRLLLEAEGDVVTRDQLRGALWPEETFVDFEHGVNTAVKKLRQALKDSVENPKFVETLPKIGYRFMVSVEWVNNSERKPPAFLPSAETPVACTDVPWWTAHDEERTGGGFGHSSPSVAPSVLDPFTPL